MGWIQALIRNLSSHRARQVLPLDLRFHQIVDSPFAPSGQVRKSFKQVTFRDVESASIRERLPGFQVDPGRACQERWLGFLRPCFSLVSGSVFIDVPARAWWPRPEERHRAEWRPRSGWDTSLVATGFESSSGSPWFCLLDGWFQ